MALSKKCTETATAEGYYHTVKIRREGTTILSVTLYIDREEEIDLNLDGINEFMECCEFIKQQLGL